MFNKTFKHLKDIFLLDKRHLTVNLSELRLTVGAKVLVAEALDNLEVAVETADHQKLLESLGRLGQSIKLSGIHARRHDEVACALGSRLDQHGSLDLEETF